MKLLIWFILITKILFILNQECFENELKFYSSENEIK